MRSEKLDKHFNEFQRVFEKMVPLAPYSSPNQAGKKTKLQALGFGHDVDADPNSTHKFITTGASQAAEPSKGPAKQRGSLRSFNAPLI